MTVREHEPAVSAAGALTLDRAYEICRGIAKREAKNFYYAFVALPPARRNAICAIYAFMRKADDLSDDETQSRQQRRLQLDAWLGAWHTARNGASTEDPVFIAVRDASSRFNIPFSLRPGSSLPESARRARPILVVFEMAGRARRTS